MGKITVFLDTETYESKVNDLLSSDKTYSKLSKDPTPIYKNKLLKILKQLKEYSTIEQSLYEKLRPSACVVPCIYGLPKVHKKFNTSETYRVEHWLCLLKLARFVSDLLSPLVGKSPHHIQNSNQRFEIGWGWNFDIIWCHGSLSLMVRDIVHYWSQIVFIVSCISLLCIYNSIIDLFREEYQGLKSEVWQLIPRWSSGSVDWLMIIGLGFDSPHILIWKYNKFW